MPHYFIQFFNDKFYDQPLMKNALRTFAICKRPLFLRLNELNIRKKPATRLYSLFPFSFSDGISCW
ncbi:hypothetical protein CW304_25905 [Bacillus sp. UFRGS-B20]|nr:hypothetical protein CW304_25905 [Bacillus sp. UFRGS-B20]